MEPNMPRVAVGEMVKVHLPDEWPWAEVTRVVGHDQFVGRIDNKLVGSGDSHNYECDDVALFGWMDGAWEVLGKVADL